MDAQERGYKAYKKGKSMKPPEDLTYEEKKAWEDGWLDHAAFDPNNDEISPSDAGYPEWE